MNKNLILILFFLTLFSCGSKKTEVTESPSELTNLQNEHLLEKETYADSVNAGLIEDTFKGSARRETFSSLGDLSITINYGSPGKRGRVIWNGLVSYDQVWVSGSHWATAITFSKDVMINEVTVPAGMYGFFTIPGRENWTLILNKDYDQHLADNYDESKDVIRISAQPETLEDIVQRLTYSIETVTENEGYIALSWDQIKVKLPFKK